MVVKQDCTVWEAGENLYGEQGTGKVTDPSTVWGGTRRELQQMMQEKGVPFTDAKEVFCGVNASYIIKLAATLWVAGTEEKDVYPKQMLKKDGTSLTNVAKVVCSRDFSACRAGKTNHYKI